MLKRVILICVLVLMSLIILFETGNNEYAEMQKLNVGEKFIYYYPGVEEKQENCIESVDVKSKSEDEEIYKYKLCDDFYMGAQNYTLKVLDENYREIKGAQVLSLLNDKEDKYDKGEIIIPTSKVEDFKYIMIVNELESGGALAIYNVEM